MVCEDRIKSFHTSSFREKQTKQLESIHMQNNNLYCLCYKLGIKVHNKEIHVGSNSTGAVFAREHARTLQNVCCGALVWR